MSSSVPDRAAHVLAEYEAQQPVYVAFTDKILGLTVEILKQAGIRVHSVNARVKNRDSLTKKLARPDRLYTRLSEVTDISGIRITTYFEDDVDRVAELITREFQVDAANSLDRRAILDPDRFGYLSLHHVITLTPDRYGLTEYRRFRDYPAEIQTRSILQHAWAEIEHDLGYKSRLGVPKEIRRRFSRLAGLLELADREFSEIRDELSEYEREVPDQIANAPDLVGVDEASLVAYATTSDVLRRIDEGIARLAGAVVYTSNANYLEGEAEKLQAAGIRTIAQLDETLRSNEKRVLDLARLWLEGTRYPELSAGIGVFYLWYLLVGATKDKEAIAEQLEHFSIGKADTRPGTADKLVRIMAELSG